MLKHIRSTRFGKDENVVLNTNDIICVKQTLNNIVVTLRGDFKYKTNKDGKEFYDGDVWFPQNPKLFEFMVNEEPYINLGVF